MNSYIENASRFLDNLIKDMDIELFIEQYEALDHEKFKNSTLLTDPKILSYYDFCRKNALHHASQAENLTSAATFLKSFSKAHYRIGSDCTTPVIDVEITETKSFFDNTKECKKIKAFHSESLDKLLHSDSRYTDCIRGEKYNFVTSPELDYAA